MAGHNLNVPQEVKTRSLRGIDYNNAEREEAYNKFIKKFGKFSAEEFEGFNRTIMHMNKDPDRKIDRHNTNNVKRLTYKRRKELGLYTLGRKSLKYKELLPLHKLWKKYMTSYLNLDELREQNWNNSNDHPSFDQVSIKLYRADYHGSKMTVIRSTCPSHVGKNGIVAMDTKNCFKLLGNDDIVRTIPKATSVFRFKIDEFDFTFFGKNLLVRPAERSSRKIKTVQISDL